VIHRAAGAVTLDPMHFSDRREEYSVVMDAARYVRIDREVCGAIHSREGPLARMGHLLESDRSGYRKLVQDDTERAGYYHTVTLGPKRIREAFPDHRIPKEFKHTTSRETPSRCPTNTRSRTRSSKRPTSRAGGARRSGRSTTRRFRRNSKRRSSRR